VFVGLAHHTRAVLELGLGNYAAALSAAQDACLDELLVTRTLPDVVEAAARSGKRKVGVDAVARLAESTRASGTEWGLGMLARSQALVARDGEADALYLEAIDHLNRCRATTHLARTRLVYGEWLRRRRRRRDAREQLRAAHELFESMGATAFAERTRTELVATGEHVRRRTTEEAEKMTPHEWRIARLVSEGGTNSEVAAQLFVSARTVEYHLGKVFKKLGVSSRTELAHTLLTPDDEP
jgi:DNA-binding CsgD family transcriptional regulator